MPSLQDFSLVRHLMQQLLQLVAPPFSEPFARRLLLMLRHTRTLEAHRAAESKQPLIACAQQVLPTPGLEALAQETLDALRQSG